MLPTTPCSHCKFDHEGLCPLLVSAERICAELAIRDAKIRTLTFALSKVQAGPATPTPPGEKIARQRQVLAGTKRAKLLEILQQSSTPMTSQEVAAASGIRFNEVSSLLSRMSRPGVGPVELVGMRGNANLYTNRGR